MKRLFFLMVCVAMGIQCTAKVKHKEIQIPQGWQPPKKLFLCPKAMVRRKGIMYLIPRLRKDDFKFIFQVGEGTYETIPPQKRVMFFTNETSPRYLGSARYSLEGNSECFGSLRQGTWKEEICETGQ